MFKSHSSKQVQVYNVAIGHRILTGFCANSSMCMFVSLVAVTANIIMHSLINYSLRFESFSSYMKHFP